MRATRLPHNLAQPFAVQTAREVGVSWRRLRAADLATPFHGVRDAALDRHHPAALEGELQSSVRRRSVQYAARMRDCEFSCLVAAAVLWNGPLPPAVFRIRERGGPSRERPLDVGVLLPARAARGRGVIGTSLNPEMGSVRVEPRSGLRATSPATTWAMMGAHLSRDDLVALGDAFVRVPMRSDDPPALATVAELAAAAGAGRRRGAAVLREALPLVRTRSRSRQETALRLLMTTDGMPEPALNRPVVVDGLLVAQIDLSYPERMLGFEYEGEHHLLDPDQWARDIRRYEMLTDLGWRIVRVTKSDLNVHRGAFLARARAAFAARPVGRG